MSVSLTDPREVMEVLMPFALRSLASGSVTPEKGRLTLPSRTLEEEGEEEEDGEAVVTLALSVGGGGEWR